MCRPTGRTMRTVEHSHWGLRDKRPLLTDLWEEQIGSCPFGLGWNYDTIIKVVVPFQTHWHDVYADWENWIVWLCEVLPHRQCITTVVNRQVIYSCGCILYTRNTTFWSIGRISVYVISVFVTGVYQSRVVGLLLAPLATVLSVRSDSPNPKNNSN